MKLLRKLDQNRRDFKGEYQCEACQFTKIDASLCSYDDDYYHNNVIPATKCEQCGKSTKDLGLPNERMATKYAPDEVV